MPENQPSGEIGTSKTWSGHDNYFSRHKTSLNFEATAHEVGPEGSPRKLKVQKGQPISRRLAKYNGHPVLVEPVGKLASATAGVSNDGESVIPGMPSSYPRLDPLPKPMSPHSMRAQLSSHAANLRILYFNTGTILDLLGWIEQPLDHGDIIYYWILKLYLDQFQSNDLWSLAELLQSRQDLDIATRVDIAYSIVESVHCMHLNGYYSSDLQSENVLFIPLKSGDMYSIGPSFLLAFDLEHFGESRAGVVHAR